MNDELKKEVLVSNLKIIIDGINQIINTIENYGIQEAIKNQWVSKLDSNLYEVRSKQGSNIQRGIYFHLEGTKYVITHGFTKKTQKTPKREMTRGRLIRDNYIELYQKKGADKHE